MEEFMMDDESRMADKVKALFRNTDPVRRVEMVQVLRVTAVRGRGVEVDPVREVVQYWDLEGNLAADVDPVGDAYRTAGEYDQERRWVHLGQMFAAHVDKVLVGRSISSTTGDLLRHYHIPLGLAEMAVGLLREKERGA